MHGDSTEWRVLQLADSAFPAGALAHSGGLEAAWQHGEVPRLDDFRAWLDASLRQTGSAVLPLVVVAHRQPDRFPELDLVSEAWISNAVANRASRQQGRSFWMATRHAFAELGDAEGAPTPGHFAPVFGSRCRALHLDVADTVRVFLFGQLRGWIGAGVRLGIVGPLAAQGIQSSLAGLASRIAVRAHQLELDDLAQTAPLLDLWQGAQDRLGSRLFQS